MAAYNWVSVLANVSTKLTFHFFKGGLECRRERGLYRYPRRKQLEKLCHVRNPLGISVQNQVVHECPRFGVEDALLVALVVIRRLGVDFEKRPQWEHPFLPK